MKILWLTWKDLKHPLAGGAEVVNEELAKRLASDGHEVRFVAGGFAGASPEDQRDGYTIARVGGRFSVYWCAYQYYKKHLSDWPDFVIDEMNTVPFFAKFYVRQKNIMFVHQLCRITWLYQMVFPFSLIGYVIEPFYLWLLRDRTVVTVSQSSKSDLIRHGFYEPRIHVISVGIDLVPVRDFTAIKKFDVPTILAFGAIRAMKRTMHIVCAFEILKQSIPHARLIIAGDTAGAYGARTLRHIARSPYKKDIQILGAVSKDKKVELMQRSHILAVTSVKEGWGLVVTEAASQGTLAVVYNVDGLRDSVRHNATGIICTQNTPDDLAENMAALLRDQALYAHLQKHGWEWSKEITFDKSYQQFLSVLKRQ